MICSNCKIRWADLPANYPYEMLTEEEELERVKIFENDEIRCCPMCIEELNARIDGLKNSLTDADFRNQYKGTFK